MNKFVLIDTWWNVNVTMFTGDKSNYGVLIDTWWNVNDDQILINQGVHTVLIDTWWNVNVVGAGITIFRKCFNRYMVECECTLK